MDFTECLQILALLDSMNVSADSSYPASQFLYQPQYSLTDHMPAPFPDHFTYLICTFCTNHVGDTPVMNSPLLKNCLQE